MVAVSIVIAVIGISAVVAWFVDIRFVVLVKQATLRVMNKISLVQVVVMDTLFVV